MNARSVCGTLLLISGALTAGCDGLLGFGNKKFEDTSSSGTGGTGGSGASGGTGAGGSTASTGGTGGTGGSTTTGTGGTGATCGQGVLTADVTDEFDFDLCGLDSTEVLKSRGWRFTREEEKYPAASPDHENMVLSGHLYSGLKETLYWFNGAKGVLMYKEITGDFLVVTSSTFSEAASIAVPGDDQAGAGLMARDPASASATKDFGEQRWIAIDRGESFGTSYVHPAWQRFDNTALSTDVAGAISGRVALCRKGSVFEVWAKEDGGPWVDMSSYISAAPMGEMPATLQVGLFVYAYNPAPDSPAGVKGNFDYVRQHDLAGGSCDPGDYGE